MSLNANNTSSLASEATILNTPTNNNEGEPVADIAKPKNAKPITQLPAKQLKFVLFAWHFIQNYTLDDTLKLQISHTLSPFNLHNIDLVNDFLNEFKHIHKTFKLAFKPSRAPTVPPDAPTLKTKTPRKRAEKKEKKPVTEIVDPSAALIQQLVAQANATDEEIIAPTTPKLPEPVEPETKPTKPKIVRKSKKTVTET